jgi:hypothetical protein
MRFTALLLLLFHINAGAQVLSSRAKMVSLQDKDKVMINLSSPLSAFSQPTGTPGWFLVRVVVMVEKTSVNEDDVLMKGSNIYNQNGENVGVTASNITVIETSKAQGRSNRDKWLVVLEGKAFKTQFERGSVPELELEQLFLSGKRGMMGRMVDDFISENRLTREDRGDYSFYPIYKSNYTLSSKEDFKLLIVYKKGGSFYGIVTNGFQMEIPTKSTYEDDPLFFYFPVMKASESDFNDIYDMVFDFIAL